jgi:hypothetical protein
MTIGAGSCLHQLSWRRRVSQSGYNAALQQQRLPCHGA